MTTRLAELFARRSALGLELAELDQAIALELAGPQAAPAPLRRHRRACAAPRVDPGIVVSDLDAARARRLASR